MPYTGTKAQSGAGSVLAIGTTSPLTIGEIRSIDFSGEQWSTVDVTNFGSGTNAEWISTIKQNGTVKLTGSRVSTDPGQAACEAAFQSGALAAFTLTLPKNASQTTTGDVITFSALVESRDFNVDITKEISWSVSLKISGAVNLAEGS